MLDIWLSERESMFDEINKEELKQLLFEVYSAGFEVGYLQKVDIVTAYNEYWNNLLNYTKEVLRG